MLQEVQIIYYILAVAALVIGAGWTAFSHLGKRIQHIEKQITTYETRHATAQQVERTTTNMALERNAHRITTLRLDVYQRLAEYVTRNELDKRLEKIEHMQYVQSTKMDTVIERLATLIGGSQQ